MTETRAAYVTERVVSDSDITEALRLFDAAGINPRRLLALARACERCAGMGWGRVVIVWVNSLPELLLVEESHKL